MFDLTKKFNFFSFVGAFILMYNPPLAGINLMHVVGFISLICCCRRFDKKLNDDDLFLISIFSIEFIFLLLVSFYYGTGIKNAAVPIYFLVDFIPFSIYLRHHCEDNNITSDDVLDFVIFVGLIQSALALLSFFFQPVQLFFIQRLIAYGYTDEILKFSAYRMFGFASTLTFAMPVLQTILSMIAIRKAMEGKWIYIVYAFFLFASGLVNARTSIVVLLIGIIVLALFSRISLVKKIFFVSVFFLLGIFTISILLPYLDEWNHVTYLWLNKGFDDIEGIVLQGNDSYWTSEEKNQLPDGIISKIFGVGHKTTGMTLKYGYASDVGYINIMWLGGIVYMMLISICYGKICIKLFFSKHSIFSFIGLLLLVVLVVVNVKGLILTMNGVTFLAVLLFLLEEKSGLNTQNGFTKVTIWKKNSL